jgi:hypothetical protein
MLQATNDKGTTCFKCATACDKSHGCQCEELEITDEQDVKIETSFLCKTCFSKIVIVFRIIV